MYKRRTISVYDSYLDVQYPNHRIYAVAYEPFWQSIRTELRWANILDAQASYTRCVAYVNLGKDFEVANRTWRVFNLLCAIPHGQVDKNSIHYVELTASKFLLEAQDEFRNRLESVGYPTEWDWNITRQTATQIYNNDPDVLIKILKPILKNRARRSHPKPELRHYLSMIQEIMGEDYPHGK